MFSWVLGFCVNDVFILAMANCPHPSLSTIRSEAITCHGDSITGNTHRKTPYTSPDLQGL